MNIGDFLKRNKTMVAMVVMVILVGLGEKMAERFLPLYILAIGGSTWVVGGLNAMDNLLSALYSLPGGYAADKIGFKRSLFLFTALAMGGYLIVILFRSWQAVLVGAVFFISWTAVSLPAVMSLVSKAVPKERRALGVSIHSFFRRIPMALGPIIGGLLIGAYGTKNGVLVAFGAAFIMAGFSLFLIQRYMDNDAGEGKDRGSQKIPFKDMFNPALRSLLASDILIRFAEQIPYAFVVVWAVNSNGLTALQFGVLTTIEMVTAMLVYIPVANLSDKYGKKRFVLITFGFLPHFRLCFCSHIHFRCLWLRLSFVDSRNSASRREKPSLWTLRRRQQRRAPSAFTILSGMSLYQLRHFRALRSGISPRQSIFLLLQGSGLQASSFLRYLERT
jgi:Arabinose efflux permease